MESGELLVALTLVTRMGELLAVNCSMEHQVMCLHSNIHIYIHAGSHTYHYACMHNTIMYAYSAPFCVQIIHVALMTDSAFNTHA